MKEQLRSYAESCA
jgi:hypothetical protein